MSQVVTLLRLQKIDSRRDQILTRLAAIDQILSEDLALAQAQQTFTDAEADLAACRAAPRQAEDAVLAQNIKIEQGEAALYGGRIQNPKELQDLQNDVAALKRYLRVLEDQQLEAMVAVEESEARLATAGQELKAAQTRSDLQFASLVAERAALGKESEKLAAERQAAVSATPADTLAIYERLRQQKHGVAISAVADGACLACGATLTPANLQIARSPTQISYCHTCGRILYAG